MPRDLLRRQDIYRDNERRQANDANPLQCVFDVLNQAQAGIRPAEPQIVNAIGTLLGMIGEEKRKRNSRTLPGQQPVDVQYPRANRMLGMDGFQANELPATNARTVADERNIANVLDDMGVPAEARDLAPHLLNNIVANGDGTYQSADGTFNIGRREQVLMMIQRTLQEIGEEMSRCNGHATVDIGPDLRARLTTRGNDGRRRLLTVDPRQVTDGREHR